MKICHIASADLTIKFILLKQILFFKNLGFDVSAVCSDGKWVQEIENNEIKIKKFS